MKRKPLPTTITWILGLLLVCTVPFFGVDTKSSTEHQCAGIAMAFSPMRATRTGTGTYTRSLHQHQSTTSRFANLQENEWFQQKPGEPDVAYIKRITSSAPPPPPPPSTIKNNDTSEGNATTTNKGGYQRIEDWEAQQQEARKNGDLSWEEKVQFDGQRFGNQVRQNDILMRQINSGL